MTRTAFAAQHIVRAIVVLAVLATALLPMSSEATTPATADAANTNADAAACPPDPATPKRQFRAMWIASVANIDWPSRTGLGVATQQAEFRAWLDMARQQRHNAVVVQIRPTADAFWPSTLEPWSQWLTGTQGTDPGYDPLAFMVAEAHARNLEFHAWFNPYRVATHTDLTRLAASHPARRNPSWSFGYNGQRYYDPGIPAVRTFVQRAMMDAVTRYDVDGVHFDDYFYPYPASGQSLPDQATYEQYGTGFNSIGDWRRNNVNLLVQEMSQRIHTAKPWVKFGISPFGIWRNASTDPLGSPTSGLQSYDAIYADTRRWVRQGWLDYVAPQLYWHIGFATADYAKLVAWWSGVVSGTGVQLLVGQATYRAGASGQDAAWQDPAELTDHLFVNREHPRVAGDIQFSAKDVRANRIGAVSRLNADHYTRPALVPLIAARGGSAPAAPSITSAVRNGSTVALSWQRAGSASPTSYAIYRVPGSGPTQPCEFADAENLVATVRATGTGGSYTDTPPSSTATYTYHVTGLDRLHNESQPSAGRVVGSGGGGGSTNIVVDNGTAGGFTASANWGTSSFSTQRHGNDYRYATPDTTTSDPAWFRASLPSTGTYRVEVWYPADPGYNSATPFLVATSTGNQSVVVDQRTGGGGWRQIGTFTLAGGTHNVVGVSRWTSGTGYVVADAIRITSIS